MGNGLRIGVINWDAFYPCSYFGKWALNSLGNPAFERRLPYFVRKTEKGYVIPERTQEQYDRELAYAAEAGIDFFAYCWYTEEETEPLDPRVNPESPILKHICELNGARKLYRRSPMNRTVSMAAILLGMHGYSERDFSLLAETMSEPYYEKEDGRPLVFLFGGYDPAFIARVRSATEKRGLDPFICFFNNAPDRADGDYSAADAVSDYAECVEGVSSPEELTAEVLLKNDARLKYGLPVIPTCPLGWDPSPRAVRPVPWANYPPEGKYSPEGEGEDWEERMSAVHRWMAEYPDHSRLNRILCFAWNEFEEGGWLCPTLGADGLPDAERLRNFRAAADAVRNI